MEEVVKKLARRMQNRAMAMEQVDWEIHTMSRSSAPTLPAATFFDHLSSQ
jgi:hypothetical protein